MSVIETVIGRTRTTLSLLVVMVLVGLGTRAALPIANDPQSISPYFISE